MWGESARKRARSLKLPSNHRLLNSHIHKKPYESSCSEAFVSAVLWGDDTHLHHIVIPEQCMINKINFEIIFGSSSCAVVADNLPGFQWVECLSECLLIFNSESEATVLSRNEKWSQGKCFGGESCKHEFSIFRWENVVGRIQFILHAFIRALKQ